MNAFLIGYFKRHALRKPEYLIVSQLYLQHTRNDKHNVSPFAPVIGQETGRVID